MQAKTQFEINLLKNIYKQILFQIYMSQMQFGSVCDDFLVIPWEVDSVPCKPC